MFYIYIRRLTPIYLFLNIYLYIYICTIYRYGRLATMLTQAATGLWAMHKSRIIHRDVAARNFLVDEHFDVAICDFGLSQELSRGENFGVTQGGPWKW